MTIDPKLLGRLSEQISAGQLSRRDVLKRSLALGLSAPAIATLMAACGGGDDDDDDAATEPEESAGAEMPAAQLTATAEAQSDVTEGDGDATAGATDEAATETEAADEPSGQRGGGGTLRLLYWQAPTILNVHMAQGTKDEHAGQICLEPLFNWDEHSEPLLVLAAEWPTIDNELLDPDGMFVIWKLKQGVKWHDGEEFNAEDVKFTWEYASNPDTTATSMSSFQKIESVDIIDDYTVQLNFSEPNPGWHAIFSGGYGVVLPEHILRDYVGDSARDAEFNLHPIGTGPWKVREFKPGDVGLWDINPEYHEPGIPYFDTVELKGGGDAVSAARAVVQTGEADWAWNLQVEPRVLNQLEDDGEFGEILPIPDTDCERIMINFADPNAEVDGAFSEPTTKHPIWQHKQAREALSLAVQRDVIAEQLYGDGGVATGDILNAPDRFKLDWPWEYNLEAAKEKLAEINFPADFESNQLLYLTSVNTVRQKTQEVVKADLEQLGFSVELKSVDSSVFFSSDAGNPDNYPHFYADIEMYTNGPDSPYPIYWATRFRSDDIAQKSNNWAGTNITRYDNPDVDALHDQAQVEIDEGKQNQIWTEMLTMIYEDIPEVPIVWRSEVAAKHKRLKNVSVSTFGSIPVMDIKNWTAEE